MKSYNGKTALVTGASSGIGKAIAENLGARGANLILVARSSDKLEQIADAIQEKNKVNVTVIVSDLAKPDAAEQLFAVVEQQRLTVDLLVNNAGFGRWGCFEDDDLPTYNEMIDLNIGAVTALCHLFMPKMASRGDCGVLNIGSTASFIPIPWAAVYGATKAYVLSFSEALSYEYKNKGVQVTVLCPGNTDSNFASVANSSARQSQVAGDSAEMVAEIGLNALLKGQSSIISGQNQKVALLPRILTRQRVLSIVGETWKKQLIERGVRV
jgi:uncharacterized protein